MNSTALKVVALAIACAFFVIPSLYPPGQFAALMHSERVRANDQWGESAASRIAARAGRWHTAAASFVDQASGSAQAAVPSGTERALSAPLRDIGKRFFANDYFRSIGAMVALAALRLSLALEHLLLFVVFAVVVIVDGYVVRLVRSKEFVAHSAELFGASVLGVVVCVATAIVGLLLPTAIHPWFVVGCALVAVLLFSRAIANYHLIR
jgi:hypothetical protein